MLIKNTRYEWLVTTTVLNTKVCEVEKKIANTGGLVTATILSTKINEVENKFLITRNILLLLNFIS